MEGKVRSTKERNGEWGGTKAGRKKGELWRKKKRVGETKNGRESEEHQRKKRRVGRYKCWKKEGGAMEEEKERG